MTKLMKWFAEFVVLAFVALLIGLLLGMPFVGITDIARSIIFGM